MNDNVTPIKPVITIDCARQGLVIWLRQVADQLDADKETPVAFALLVRGDNGVPLVQATGFCDNERAVQYFTRAMGDRLGWA
jgi:hypothetical protein